MKFEAGQEWVVKLHHRQLRFREVLTGQRLGAWRLVNRKPYWKIDAVSVLPKNLFVPLNDSITGNINKISRPKRKLPSLRRRTRSILLRSAKVFRGCTAEEESKTHIKFILDHKPFVHFLIVDFQDHDPDKFHKKDSKGNVLKSRWGKPVKDLKAIAHAIRKDKGTGLRELEHESKALLRLMVVFLSDGNVWLVPARARLREKDGD